MYTYSMTCACGHVFEVRAANREAAVVKLQDMMDEEAIEAHMADKHPGEPVLSMQKVHAMIEQGVEEVAPV